MKPKPSTANGKPYTWPSRVTASSEPAAASAIHFSSFRGANFSASRTTSNFMSTIASVGALPELYMGGHDFKGGFARCARENLYRDFRVIRVEYLAASSSCAWISPLEFRNVICTVSSATAATLNIEQTIITIRTRLSRRPFSWKNLPNVHREFSFLLDGWIISHLILISTGWHIIFEKFSAALYL